MCKDPKIVVSDSQSEYRSKQPTGADRESNADAGKQSATELLATASVAIGAAAFLRLYELALKPLHHDEGVNGFFLLELFRKGVYRYNPANYHGPTLYYFSLIVCSINNLLFRNEGPSTVAIRVLPAFFGIGIVALVFAFRQRLGLIATVSAAALIAFSPGMVYVSRDFIHETLLGFFTLLFVVCSIRFAETHRSRELMLSTLAAALMAATKETAPISWFALLVAGAMAFLIVPLQRKLSLKDFGGGKVVVRSALAAGLLFIACGLLFFSSFLGNYPQGLRDAVSTYRYWARTGMTQQTAPLFTYLGWLCGEEAPIFVIGMIGTAVALFKRDNRFAVFAGSWGLGLLLLYSVLPHKTPWILLNVIMPMALAAGYAIETAWAGLQKSSWGRIALLTMLCGVLAASLYQSIQLNFFHYDDGRYVYSYAHTERGFTRLVNEVNRIAGARREGEQTSIAVLSPDYWPLPWYLRDYKNVGYYGHLVQTNANVVIGSMQQKPLIEHTFSGYHFNGSYPLRPGVELELFVADDASQ